MSAAEGVLKALEAPSVPLAGLAKKNEELFLPGRAEPVLLPEASDALRLLQAVRDEAHRFATTFHKKLRGRQAVTSVLEGVRGIGPRKAALLLERFGSLEALAAAAPEAVARAAGVSREVAEEVRRYLAKHLPAARRGPRRSRGTAAAARGAGRPSGNGRGSRTGR